jgi:hypothetical protein
VQELQTGRIYTIPCRLEHEINFFIWSVASLDYLMTIINKSKKEALYVEIATFHPVKGSCNVLPQRSICPNRKNFDKALNCILKWGDDPSIAFLRILSFRLYRQ